MGSITLVQAAQMLTQYRLGITVVELLLHYKMANNATPRNRRRQAPAQPAQAVFFFFFFFFFYAHESPNDTTNV